MNLYVYPHGVRFVYYKELKAYWANSGQLLKPVQLCIGGEWHRFPSSFYIPDERVRLSFLRSDFHGQLPQPFPVSYTLASLDEQIGMGRDIKISGDMQGSGGGSIVPSMYVFVFSQSIFSVCIVPCLVT